MSESRQQDYFLKRVAEDMVSRFGKNLRDIAVVFNNKRPAQYLTRFLSQEIGEVFWSPRFFTIQEFIRAGHPFQEISGTAQAFLLNQIHTNLQKEVNPHFAESLAHFFPVAELVLSDFQQLDFEMIDANQIYADLQNITILESHFDSLTNEQKSYLKRFWATFSAEKHTEMHQRFLELWQILPELYMRFKAELTSQELQTMAGMYRDVAQNPSLLDPLLKPFKKTLFVGFNALNACEVTLFQRWQREGKALFYFDVDAHYMHDELQEAGRFVRRNIQLYGLENALSGEEPHHIGSSWLKEMPVEVIAAPGHAAQAKSAAILLENHPPSVNTAIVLADETLLVPLLQSLPSNINPNITMGYPFAESLVAGFINIYLQGQLFHEANPDLEGEFMDYTVLMDYMTHPFNRISAQLQFEFKKLVADMNTSQVPLDLIARSDGNINDFFAPKRAGNDLIDGLVNLFQHLRELSAEQESRRLLELNLVEKAEDAIRQLQQALRGYPDLGVGLIQKLINRVLGQISATLQGDATSGVQIMGLLESRNLHFDRIILLGAGEGHLPPAKPAPSLIPYHLRKAYGLSVLDDQNGLSAYLFYRLFHVQAQVSIFYNAQIDTGNSGEVSRFVKQLAYESSIPFDFKNLSFQVTESAAPSTGFQVEQSRKIKKEGLVWQRLSDYFADNSTGNSRTLSASAFSLYVNSPMEFFLKYIAGIKEPPVIQEEIQANRLGNIIHQVMEWCYAPYLQNSSAVGVEDIKSIKTLVPSLCRRAIEQEFGRKHFASQENIMLSLSQAYCLRFLEYDAREAAPFTPIELENTEDYLMEFAITVKGEQKKVRLKGIIDRIDVGKKGLRIVDYKTGGDVLEVSCTDPGQIAESPNTFFFDTNWDKSNKAFLQLLYYTHIYEQVSGKTAVSPHLYSIRNLEQGSEFILKYKRTRSPLQPHLPLIKEQFVSFLRQKLEELFDPEIPFEHPLQATVYEGNPLSPFLLSDS